jgi:hypothetical protein
MSQLRLLSLLSLCAALLLGCGSATTAPPSTRVTAAPPALKTIVEALANSGEIGSGADELKKEFEKLKTADAAKADSIAKEFDALLAADGKPAKVKQLATELAAKL